MSTAGTNNDAQSASSVPSPSTTAQCRISVSVILGASNSTVARNSCFQANLRSCRAGRTLLLMTPVANIALGSVTRFAVSKRRSANVRFRADISASRPAGPLAGSGGSAAGDPRPRLTDRVWLLSDGSADRVSSTRSCRSAFLKQDIRDLASAWGERAAAHSSASGCPRPPISAS
jgi:hypothetical protein